jgi:hypothetical protein
MPIRRRPRTPEDEPLVGVAVAAANGDGANPKTPLLRPKTPIRGQAIAAAVATATDGMTAAEAAEALKGVGLMNLDFMRTMSDPTMRYGPLITGGPTSSPPPPDRQRSEPTDGGTFTTSTTSAAEKKQLAFADDDTLRSPASGAIIAIQPAGVDAAQLREWQLGRAPETAYGYHSMEMDEDHRIVTDPLQTRTATITPAGNGTVSSSSSSTNTSTILSGRPP